MLMPFMASCSFENKTVAVAIASFRKPYQSNFWLFNKKLCHEYAVKLCLAYIICSNNVFNYFPIV